MTTPNLEQLKLHRARIANCFTFDAYLEAQIEFVDLLIRLIEDDEEKLKDYARQVLGIER